MCLLLTEGSSPSSQDSRLFTALSLDLTWKFERFYKILFESELNIYQSLALSLEIANSFPISLILVSLMILMELICLKFYLFDLSNQKRINLVKQIIYFYMNFEIIIIYLCELTHAKCRVRIVCVLRIPFYIVGTRNMSEFDKMCF